MNIYLVEDDTNIREMMIYALTGKGFHVSGFADSKAFDKAMRIELPDLILLDVMLPGEDGLSVLKRLKVSKRTAHIPVIMATAKSSEMDKVIGLDSGADDYITKPFGILELISRINAVARRTERKNGLTAGRFHRYEDLVIDAERHIVTLHEKEIHLTRKEFMLLWFLLENRGYVVTRENIMEYVWGTDFDVETRTIDIHINTLRRKLQDDGTMIRTVRGIGYTIRS
ncbi:MAG: response regulator transcription factor [Clostridia bacterium]|nr:response regulator transcription factor [Clostridia bacterium]